MEVFIYTSSAAQIALLPLCQHISIWNKGVSCFRGNNLFHVLFGRLFCWPSSSQSVQKKNGNSLFWVLFFSLWIAQIVLCLLAEVTESLPFLLPSLSCFAFSFFFFLFTHLFLYVLYDSVFLLLLLLFLFLIDDVPPYFKMEPPQTQVHLEGNRLVLTCMAEGSWPLEFKWIYNGTELTRFSLEYRWGMQPCLPAIILFFPYLNPKYLTTWGHFRGI